MKTGEAIAEIYGLQTGKKVKCPLFLSGVSAGFPSPADDYIDRILDLNELLITNPPATFFVKVTGDSMIGAGINDGDILVVDRSRDAGHNKIIIAAINSELTVKRLHKANGICRLMADNPAYAPLELNEDNPCEIWGVVTSVIHQFEK